MASAEINKLLMRAVSDSNFRSKFLDDPAAAAKENGASETGIREAGSLNMGRLRAQFDQLSRVSTDLLKSVVAAGHSSDHLDRSNIHDNDGHVHDKAGDSRLNLGDLVSNPGRVALDPSAVRDALKDPAILREIETNPQIKAALKNAIK